MQQSIPARHCPQSNVAAPLQFLALHSEQQSPLRPANHRSDQTACYHKKTTKTKCSLQALTRPSNILHVTALAIDAGMDWQEQEHHLVQFVLLGQGNCLAPPQGLLIDESTDAPELHELVLL